MQRDRDRDRDRDNWRRREDDDWRSARGFGTDPSLRERWGSEGRYETDNPYGSYDDRYASSGRAEHDRSDYGRMHGRDQYSQDRFRQRQSGWSDDVPGAYGPSEGFRYADRYEPRYPMLGEPTPYRQEYGPYGQPSRRPGHYSYSGMPSWDYDEGRRYSEYGTSPDRGDYGSGPAPYDESPYGRGAYRRPGEDWRREGYARSQLGGTYGQGRTWQGHNQRPRSVDDDFGRAGQGIDYRQFGGEYPVHSQARYGHLGAPHPDYGRWAFQSMWDYRHGLYTGLGPRGYQRSDDRIREDVNELLTHHGDIDATDIEVGVRDGEVILTGTVDSGWTRRATEEAVERVPGVRDVRNELRVSRSSGYDMSGVGRGTARSRMAEQHGGFSSGPDDTRKVRIGMQVVGSDGDTVGHVKEIRERDFLVDRGAQRDVYVPFDAILNATPDAIMLRCRVDAVDDQGWSSPDLTGSSSTSSNTAR
ncbi:MAG: BON domain-containing protein [Chloroflexi bacterium]|nr:BON domain-containing protein [Chloroflexota bacterium]